MSKSIQEWIKEDVEPLKRKGSRFLAEMAFFREPMRATILDDDFIFTPADGIIVNQKIIKGYEEIINVKGKSYTLEEAMQGRFFSKRQKVMIVDIFLTQYHVHNTRIPYSGYIYNEMLEQISSYNRPMIQFERDLIKGVIDYNSADYLFLNERSLTRIHCPKLDSDIFVLNIADFDVASLMCHYDTNQGGWGYQNGNLGKMLFGSTAQLIVPMNPDIKYSFTQEIGRCVYGKIDTLIALE